MDKYIKAQDIIDRIYPVDPENDGSDGCTIVVQNLRLTSDEIEALVDEIPAADVAQVVRCKNCKRWKPENFMAGNDIDHMYRGGGCSIRRFVVFENDFCSAGEKMDGGHKEG